VQSFFETLDVIIPDEVKRLKIMLKLVEFMPLVAVRAELEHLSPQLKCQVLMAAVSKNPALLPSVNLDGLDDKQAFFVVARALENSQTIFNSPNINALYETNKFIRVLLDMVTKGSPFPSPGDLDKVPADVIHVMYRLVRKIRPDVKAIFKTRLSQSKRGHLSETTGTQKIVSHAGCSCSIM
jgi:hypothetical protein